MIIFASSLIGLIVITIIIQLVTNMRIVGGNELGIVSGKGGKKRFKMISGGRIFTIPLLHKFSKIDLTPYTIEVVVDSAIADGVVPLNVKATVSFAVASNINGRERASTRILKMTTNTDMLTDVASNIIEGHLRDSIATMTPEQVMMDKDGLVARMINVCKSDLENIGLEITTMNIADVDDHRLKGVDEPELYIALLKRVQTANAETKARKARADALANSTEENENRRAEIEVRALENELEQLLAQTQVRVKEEIQREKVGVAQAMQSAKANVSGMQSKIEAEKQRIEMLKQKFEADIVTPAIATKERNILEAEQEAARVVGKAQGEIDELKETIQILAKGGEESKQTYLIENFERLIGPFAETLGFFPVDNISVITGAEGKHDPISAIHPNAIASEKNDLIREVIADALGRSDDDYEDNEEK
jgi:flotillin